MNKQNLTYFFAGFFSVFGFENIVLSQKVEDIMKKSSSEKIREDLKRINDSYKNQFLKIRKELHLN